MRVLHAIRLHERFVARGRYRPVDAAPAWDEVWSIYEQDEGAHLLRVDIDTRGYDGRSRLFELWRAPDGVIERFDVHVYGGPGDAFRQVKARVVGLDQTLYLSQARDDQPRVEAQILLPEGASLHAGPLIALGLDAGPRAVLSVHFDRRDAPLTLAIEAIDSESAEPETGAARAACVRGAGWRWCLGVDEYGIPLYAVDKAGLRLTLLDYSRRPAPSEKA